MRGGKASEADIIRKLRMHILHFRIVLPEHQILLEGQRENPEGYIAPGQISRNL